MMGQSYLAIIQFMNASNMNPHLKAIVPRYGALDLYDFVYPGGILDFNFVQVYDMAMKLLNGNRSAPGVGVYPSKPVDEDTDGSMLAAATAEHEANTDLVVLADQMVYRDSVVDTPYGEPMGYPTASPSGHLDEIEASGVAIYNMGGWLDCYAKDTISFQQTLSNESKCLIGDYDHTQGFEGSAIECVRFFDRYLKGIENGFDEEEPCYVYTTGSDEWAMYDKWPPPGAEATPYYFETGGVLGAAAPAVGETVGTYEVDYTTSSGKKTRWLAMTGRPKTRSASPSPRSRLMRIPRLAAFPSWSLTSPPPPPTAISSYTWKTWTRTATCSTSPRGSCGLPCASWASAPGCPRSLTTAAFRPTYSRWCPGRRSSWSLTSSPSPMSSSRGTAYAYRWPGRTRTTSARRSSHLPRPGRSMEARTWSCRSPLESGPAHLERARAEKGRRPQL
jgi:hypothetical protein